MFSPPPTRLNFLHPLQLAFLSFPSTRVSSPIFFPLPFSFPSHRTSAAASNYYQFNLDNSLYYKRDVMVLRYASGLFQSYSLCLSLFSPFITKLLKGAIFRLKIFLPSFCCRPRNLPPLFA